MLGAVLGPVLGAATGALLSGGGGSSVEQQPLETFEQGVARRRLLDAATSGRFGDVTFGEDLGFDTSAGTDMTEAEKMSQDRLLALVSGGIPEEFDMGRSALETSLAMSPEMVEAQFEPYRKQVEREIRNRSDDLKRRASFTGNLYGTDTIERLGDVQARGTETLAGRLAQLTNEALDRNLRGAQIAGDLGTARQASEFGLIGGAQQYGALPRLLEAAKESAFQDEVLRQRAEKIGTLDLLSTVAGTPSNFGVRSVETPSMMQNLLGSVASGFGQALPYMFMNTKIGGSGGGSSSGGGGKSS